MKKIKKTIDEILKSRYSIYRCLLRKTTSKIIFKLLLTSIDVDDMIQKLSQDESYEYDLNFYSKKFLTNIHQVIKYKSRIKRFGYMIFEN